MCTLRCSEAVGLQKGYNHSFANFPMLEQRKNVVDSQSRRVDARGYGKSQIPNLRGLVDSTFNGPPPFDNEHSATSARLSISNLRRTSIDSIFKGAPLFDNKYKAASPGSSISNLRGPSTDSKFKGSAPLSDSRNALNLLQAVPQDTLCSAAEVPEWEVLKITIDSGASETVIPKSFSKLVPTVTSPGSRSGLQYEVASGAKIPNEGEKTLQVLTEDWSPRVLTMQVCEVNKALMSVTKISKTGHRVVFDDDWSFIEHKGTGHRTTLKQEGGVYTLDLWVKANANNNTVFQGQPK